MVVDQLFLVTGSNVLSAVYRSLLCPWITEEPVILRDWEALGLPQLVSIVIFPSFMICCWLRWLFLWVHSLLMSS